MRNGAGESDILGPWPVGCGFDPHRNSINHIVTAILNGPVTPIHFESAALVTGSACDWLP
ncbi:MAG: hypothetical protein IPP22_11910 [Nitrosomonas sp.]|nr:hypothetical protein [Nitrosomonas sp.]